MKRKLKKMARELKTKSRRLYLRSKKKFVRSAFAKSYSVFFMTFTLVGFTALDWAANRESGIVYDLPATTSVSPVNAQEILKAPAWSFFHPVWRKDDKWSLNLNQESAIKLPPTVADISDLVTDPEDKIEKEFKVPVSLQSRVLFWMEIYSKYSSRIKLIHDRDEPSRIYGFIDLRPIYRALGNPVAAEVRGNEIERKVLAELKLRLNETIGNGKSTVMGAEERAAMLDFLSQQGALSQKETARLIEGIRSQTGQRDMFLKALHRSATLLPHIETVFRRKSLPVGLARLPFVESSFNVNAKSTVGAVGIWQFMPETAKQMIHEDKEDLWADPLKQTDSAARLLQIYRSLLPDWSLTVTSYNSGVGRVKGLVQKHRLKNMEDLMKAEAKDGLGFAGQNFYTEFLAAHLVEAYKEKIFTRMLGPIDFSLVFRGAAPFPKEICDL